MEEKKLAILNTGKMAEIAFTHFSGIINKKKEIILAEIKSKARNSEHDVIQYACAISSINALDDLESLMKKQIDNGRQIEKEILDNGRKQPL